MSLHGQHLIAGERSCVGATTHHATNPASGAALEPGFADASAAEIDAAVASAREAHTLGLGSARQRATFLRSAAAAIDELGDALTERAMAETGLPRGRLDSERGRTVHQLQMFADLVEEGSWVGARLDTADPERRPIPRPDLRRMLVPLGPVAIFGAGNFPLAFSVAGGDTASAIAAGCPVVVKAHPSHPGTSELVATAMTTAVSGCGLPPGSFSMVHGSSHAVGQALVEHASICAVGFTGSFAGGRALCRLAASRSRPIPVFAEMGSINPVVILPQAMVARGQAIAQGLANSLTLGVGQFCTNPGVILVPTGHDGERFVGDMLGALAAVGPGVMLDARVLGAYREGLAARAELAGVERLHAGDAGDDRAGVAVFSTTAARFVAEPSLQDELFGPSALVVRWSSTDELDALARALDGQLTATIHADPGDMSACTSLAPALADRVGRLLFNGFPTGVEVSAAMQHGGPWPASSDPRSTSVGTAAIERFARPLCWQAAPHELLPPELRDDNPMGIRRLVDGVWT